MKLQTWIGALAAALALGMPTIARGDTVFDVNATLLQTGVANPGTGTLQGTFTFNRATGALDALSLTFTNPGTNAYDGTYNLNFVFGGPTPGPPTEYGITGFLAPYQASLFLYLPVAGPVGYAGGPICSVAFACFDSQTQTVRDNSTVSVTGGSATLPFVNADYTVESGMLTAETPEPSSLLLAATGLGCVAGLLRRRLEESRRWSL